MPQNNTYKFDPTLFTDRNRLRTFVKNADVNTLESFANDMIKNKGVFLSSTAPVNWANSALQQIQAYKNTPEELRTQKQVGLFNTPATPDWFGQLNTRRSNLQVERDRARNSGNTKRAEQFDKQIEQVRQQMLNASLTPEQSLLGKARGSLTGDFQDHIANKFFQRQGQGIKEAQNSLNNLMSNIANRTDFSALSPEQVSKESPANNQALINDIENATNKLNQLEMLGVDVSGYRQSIQNLQNKINQTPDQLAGTQFTPQGAVRTDAGFVSQDNLPQNRAVQGRATPKSSIRQEADGTFSVLDEQGNVLSGGLPTTADALAKQNELQSGFAGNISGRADLTATRDNIDALLNNRLDSGREVQARENAKAQGANIAVGDRLLNPEDLKNFTEDQIIRVPNPTLGRDDIFLKSSAVSKTPPFSAGGLPSTGASGQGEPVTADKVTPNASETFNTALSSALSSGATSPDAFVQSLGSIANIFDVQSGTQAILNKERQGLIGQLQADTTALEGRGAFAQQALQDAGVNDKIAQLQDLNLMIQQRMGAYQAGENKILDQTIPQDLIIGQQASLRRQQAQEIGLMTAQASALQDNIKLAQDIAQRAVDLEFADEEQRINNTKLFLDINSDNLSREEKKQAQKVNLLLQERERSLAERKSNKQKIAQLFVDLASAGIDPTKAGIDFNKSFEENLAISSPFIVQASSTMSLADQLDLAIKQEKLKGLQNENDPFFSIFNPSPEDIKAQKEDIQSLVTLNSTNQDMSLIKQDLESLKTHKGLDNAVGVRGIGRLAPLQAGQKEDFLQKINELASQATINKLIDLKKKGGTLGAISESELSLLRSSATRIANMITYDKNNKPKNIKATKASFLEAVNDYQDKLDRMINSNNNLMSTFGTYDPLLQQQNNVDITGNAINNASIPNYFSGGFNKTTNTTINNASIPNYFSGGFNKAPSTAIKGFDLNSAQFAVDNFKQRVVGKIKPTKSFTPIKLGNKTIVLNDSVAERFKRADAEYFAKTGKHIPVSENFRTQARQQELYRKLSKRGAQVAPAGYSFHEIGMAVDVGNSWKEVKPFLRKYGFRNDLPNDRGHFSIGEFA